MQIPAHIPPITARSGLQTTFAVRLWAGLLALSLATLAAQVQVRLAGYAVLAADTFREGPPSTNEPQGLFRKPPARWPNQPVQGVSSLQSAGDGTFWALSDNGFGARRNSGTYLLAIYRLDIHWRTPAGGSGTVELLETVELRDPHGFAGKRVRKGDPDRHLTGADFDPESLYIAEDGSFWIGEEFGPWLLHFAADGSLLSVPIPARIKIGNRRIEVRSPDRGGFRRANLPRSQGFEGLTYHPRKGELLLLLEGTLRGESAGLLRLFSYLPGSSLVVEATDWRYPLERPGHAIGEISFWPGPNVLLVLERDWGHGPEAAFKRVFAWQPENWQVPKKIVVDLLAIPDPDRLASPDSIFALPDVTIESLLPIDGQTLIICNDNNYPATGGRSLEQRDATEFVMLRVEIAPESP